MKPSEPPGWPASGWNGGSVGPLGSPDASAAVDPEFSAPDAERYERAGEIGRGGMGKVTAAFDRRLGRQVALKGVAPEVDGADARRRLTREARITARLDHPGIVPVHDAGVGPEGEPFYAMRVVRGRSLAEVLAESHDLAGRLAQLRHFLAACEAVAYAHSVGVVHRDLKPANIRVGAFGETQVIDWGLARGLEETDDAIDRTGTGGDASLTRVGAVIGTPAYMSPEAARGEPADPRSDVWSLGAILHELLVGDTPFGRTGGDTTVDSVATTPATPVRVRAPDAPADLAAIVDRALEYDPARRYPDAGALARDVARWLDGGRVEAHDYTTRELAWRVVRAWRAPLVVATVAAVLLGLGGLTAVDRVLSERDRALHAERETRAALASSDHTLARSLLTSAQAASDRGSRAEAELLASHSLELVDTPQARGLLALYGAEPRPSKSSSFSVPCEVQAAATQGAWAICADGTSVSRWEAGATAPTWTVAGAPARVEVMEQDGFVALQSGEALPDRVLDAATGKLRAERLGYGYDTGLTISTDGRWAASRLMRDWQVWSTDTGEVVRLLPCVTGTGFSRVALDGPGGRVAWIDGGSRVRWSDTPDGPRHTFDLTAVVTEAVGMAWRDGHTLLLMSPRGEVALVDLDAQEVLWKATPDVGSARRLAVGATRPVVLVEGSAGAALLDARTGAQVDRLSLRAGATAWLGVDDRLVVIDDGVRVLPWPTSSGWLGVRAREGLSAVAVSSDDARVAIAGGAGVSTLFTIDGDTVVDLPPLPGVVKAVAFGPTDALWVTGPLPDGPVARAVDAATGRAASSAPIPLGGMRRLGRLGPDLLWAAAFDQWVSIYELTPTGWTESRLPAPMMSEGQSAQAGQLALLVTWEGDVWTLRLDGSGAPVVAPWLDTSGVVAVATDAVGAHRAVAIADRIDLYEGDTPTPVRTVALQGRVVVDLAVSNDGRWLASGGDDGALRVWSVDDGALRLDTRGHDGRIGGVSFNGDGSQVFTVSWDHTVRRWDLRVLDAEPATLRAEREAAWQVGLDALVSR